MVCNRCKLVVRSIFEELGLHLIRIELGVVETSEPITTSAYSELGRALEFVGFELLDDKRSRTIERIKTLIIDLIHERGNKLDQTLSDFLHLEIGQNYASLSKLFSDVEGITIEKYYINQKIERVKELLVYDELSLNEIADQMHYSSVAYLSNQFKKVTGLTPGHFKKLRPLHRRSLDKL